MKEEEMRVIAGWIDDAVTHKNDAAKLAAIKEEVKMMTDRFPLYPGIEEKCP